MKFDLKKNQGFLIVVGVGLALMVACLVMWRVTSDARDAEMANFGTSDNDYQAIVNKYNGEPTADLVQSYKGRIGRVKKKAEVMRSAVETEVLPEFTPTSFKVALKKAADKYTALRSEKNIPTPDDFGWGEFRGEVDPTKSELPKLVRQFRLTEDVVDILFNNDLDEILEIDRNPEGEMAADIDSMDIDMFSDGPSGGPRTEATREKALEKGKAVFNSVPVKFLFRVPPTKLYPILAEIRNKQQFYRIRTLKTSLDLVTDGNIKDPTDIKEILVVDMVVDHIKFL